MLQSLCRQSPHSHGVFTSRKPGTICLTATHDDDEHGSITGSVSLPSHWCCSVEYSMVSATWLDWGWDGGDGYLIGQPLPPSPHLPQQVVFISPLSFLLLGEGIIGSRGVWGAVDTKCSSWAEGAVLDCSRWCVEPRGLWREMVKLIVSFGHPFPHFWFSWPSVTEPHLPHNHTHQEYG